MTERRAMLAGAIVNARYSATGGIRSGIALSAAQATTEPLEESDV